MIRWLYWFYRRVHQLQRWLVRRLTLAGGFVVGGLVLAGTMAANPDQSLAYQAFALQLMLLLLAAGFIPLFRLRVGVERRLPRFATVGEPLRYRITVRNPSNQPQPGLEWIEEFGEDALTFTAFAERLKTGRHRRPFRLSQPLPPLEAARAQALALPPLPPGGKVDLMAEVRPLRRGALQFVAVSVGRSDPLGLVRSIHRVQAPAAVMVLPQRHPVPANALPGSTQYQHGGVTYASGVGQSEEFVGVREYRRGDSLRRVHWRVSARLGRPVVREYQDEFFVRHALVLDTFGDLSMDLVFEDAVSVAASFACTVPAQDSLLDLLFVGPKTVCVTAGRAVGHTEQMLEVLACARPCREPGRFADLQDLVLRHAARVSGCLLVLMQWDDTRRGLVRRLKALRIPVWVLLVVEAGEPAPTPDADPGSRPDRWLVLEAGKVAEGLRNL